MLEGKRRRSWTLSLPWHAAARTTKPSRHGGRQRKSTGSHLQGVAPTHLPAVKFSANFRAIALAGAAAHREIIANNYARANSKPERSSMNAVLPNAQAVTASWQPGLIALSYLISVVGSFAALTAARRIQGRNGFSLLNTLAAGTALGGIGVWATHFTGMAALSLDMAVGYSMVETLVSLAAAIGAASVALAYVANRPDSLQRLILAGPLLGLGVAVMHYLGMYGMRFPGEVIWSMPVVGISIVIAIVAATAALWLAFRTQAPSLRIVAAMVMGVAVCAMHYTGMAAADYVCTSPADRFILPKDWGVISSSTLPGMTAIVAIGLAVLILLDQGLQSTLSRQPARKRRA